MNRGKDVLLVTLMMVMSVPCFGNGVAIKRKKNKWIHEAKMTEVSDVNRDNQCKANSFDY